MADLLKGLGWGAVAIGGGLLAVGFAPAGIAAGSFAAATQAGIGNVVAGSAFAAAQSAGASGLLTTITVAGAGAAGAGHLMDGK